MSSSTIHISVLLKETIDALSPKDGDVFLDATLGGGGHTEALLRAADVRVIAFDADPQAIERSEVKLAEFKDRVTYVRSNFRHLDKELKALGVEQVSGALFDLGLSSDELEQSGRGFSFQKDEPLHMGFDPKQSLTALDLIAHLNIEQLTNIIKVYGDEHNAYRIAKGIVAKRELAPITTTLQLRETIEASVPRAYAKGRVHPATRTFQALRIAVNDEYDALKEGLGSGWNVLKKDGTLAVISFHSGEDRIVKIFMKEKEMEEAAERIFKKPLTASEDELKANPRARSAKLRVARKLI